jgi:hypothetical protein
MLDFSQFVSFDGARLVLALAVVAFALALPRRRTWLAPLAVAVAVATVGSALWSYVSSPAVRGWNVFHYYLGAEYYGELGYYDLYPAALHADREGVGAFAEVTRVRDQITYEVVRRSEAEADFDPAAHFTPERWRNFAADVEALSRHESEDDWKRIFTDRGYNATPFWSAAARGVTTLLPARRPVALKLLAGLDLVLLAVAGLALVSAFGTEGALATLLLFLLSPVDGERMIGGFLQYDWLAALALGLAARQRGRTLAAGIAFGYATLVRVFPVLFVAALLLPNLIRWVRRGRISRGALVLGGSFAVVLLVGFGVGCTTSRGVDAWREFAGKIGFHAERHVFGDQRVGLQHLFTSQLGETADGTGARRDALRASQPVVWLLGGSLLAAAGLVLLRRRGTAAFLVGLVPFYVLTVASRYYWAVLSFLPLGPRSDRRALPHLLGLVGLLFAAFYAARLAGAGRYGSYLVFDAGLLFLGLIVLGALLRRDWRTLSRLHRLRATRG